MLFSTIFPLTVSLTSTSRIDTDSTQATALQDWGGVEKTAWMISIRADVLSIFSARNLLRINLSNACAEFNRAGQASKH